MTPTTAPDRRPTRVVLVDDAVLLREGIARLLAEAGLDVVAQLDDAEQLVLRVEQLEPDLVVLDIRMPPTHTTEGLRAALRLRAARPGTAVLLLSQHVETRYAVELVADDARGVGYLLKDRVVDVESFLSAVRRVAAGDTAIDPLVVQRLLGRERRDNPLDALTGREREVLALLAEGLDNAQVADRLVLAERTVESHIANIFTKLDLHPGTEGHRRVHAVLTHLEHAPA